MSNVAKFNFKGNRKMKPKVDMKRCFASKDVCMAIKLCPVKAISYIEVDEPILDKTLKCNCDEREERGLTPMSEQGGCDCADGCSSNTGDKLYDCGGTPYGRIIIDYDKCIKCGICAKECCGDCIDMVGETENTDSCDIKNYNTSNERLLAEFFPEFTKKLDEIDELYASKKKIDEKTYQFICFALSIKGRSKPCVLKHFKGALDAGATVEELSYILALTLREAAGADDCWTHDVLSDWKNIVDGKVDCDCGGVC